MQVYKQHHHRKVETPTVLHANLPNLHLESKDTYFTSANKGPWGTPVKFNMEPGKVPTHFGKYHVHSFCGSMLIFGDVPLVQSLRYIYIHFSLETSKPPFLFMFSSIFKGRKNSYTWQLFGCPTEACWPARPSTYDAHRCSSRTRCRWNWYGRIAAL